MQRLVCACGVALVLSAIHVSALGAASELHASTAAPSGAFGRAVALSVDTLVVGSPLDDTRGAEAGAVFVFARQSDGRFVEAAKLTAPDAAAGDQFGTALSLAGDTLVIGAPLGDAGARTDAGAAYVYVRRGSAWEYQAKLVADDGARFDELGGAVALFGDRAVIGAHAVDQGDAIDAGAGYVFERAAGTWQQRAKLTLSPAQSFERCGLSVAISESAAFVGCPHRAEGVEGAGAVAVFSRSGDTYVFEAKLLAPDPVPGDAFGAAVSIDANRLVVGAPNTVGTATRAGSAHVFLRGATTWTHEAKLSSPAAVTLGGGFGGAVAARATRVMVGAAFYDDEGAAVSFVRREGRGWLQGTTYTAPRTKAGAAFGFAVGLTADAAVVGAPSDDAPGAESAGAAYLFALPVHAAGTACAGDDECASASCAGGVCCATACDAECSACSQSKTGKPDGTCAPIVAGCVSGAPSRPAADPGALPERSEAGCSVRGPGDEDTTTLTIAALMALAFVRRLKQERRR